MNTNHTTITEFDRMVADFRRAKSIHENSRFGSKRGDAAERKMEQLVARAERRGFLQAFVAEVTK